MTQLNLTLLKYELVDGLINYLDTFSLQAGFVGMSSTQNSCYTSLLHYIEIVLPVEPHLMQSE